MRSNKTFSLLTIVLLLLSFSCKKKELHWDTDIVVPILKTTLGVDDIFGDENVASNINQSMSLLIEEEVELLSTDYVVEIDDTLAVDIFNVPIVFTVSPGQKVIEKQAVSPLNFGGMELTKARAKRAKMKFYVTSMVKEALLVKYQLYSATKDGAIYETEERVEAATVNQKSYAVKEIFLDDFDLDLTGPDANDFNTIYSVTTVWVHPDGDTAIVDPQDTITIVSTFDEFEPDYAFGYLGIQELSANSSSSINVFNSLSAGSFDLNSIEASIDVKNFLGVDLSVEIDDVSVKNSSSNTVISLDNSIIGASLNMERASESGMDNYPVWSTDYSYDISNSNLDEMLEIMPDSLMLSVNALVNPLGNVCAGNDFIYFDRGLEAKIKLNIPLNLSADNLIIEEETDFDIGTESIKNGALNVFVENSFPFDLDLQFYIIDADRIIMDSLFAENTMVNAATTDGNGDLVSATNSEIKVELNPDLMTALENNDRMIIRARINTPENKKYVLYEYSNMQIKIIADVEYEL